MTPEQKDARIAELERENAILKSWESKSEGLMEAQDRAIEAVSSHRDRLSSALNTAREWIAALDCADQCALQVWTGDDERPACDCGKYRILAEIDAAAQGGL